MDMRIILEAYSLHEFFDQMIDDPEPEDIASFMEELKQKSSKELYEFHYENNETFRTKYKNFESTDPLFKGNNHGKLA